jgi:hypothetical protein
MRMVENIEQLDHEESLEEETIRRESRCWFH